MRQVQPVDEILPCGQLLILGLQHVLVMILILFGIFPRMGHAVASVPRFVLGGAGVVMFGMVAATGIKMLAGVNYVEQKANPYIIAISIAFGMIPLVADKFFQYMREALSPLLHSGILLASVAAVVLNLYFNGATPRDKAIRAAAAGAHHAEAGQPPLFARTSASCRP